MGDNKFLKIGVLAVATAATAAGSIFIADKGLKSLVKGMMNSEPTKLRQPVKDNDVEKFDHESIIREPSTETQDILPQINLNDVAAVINNANLEQIAQAPVQDSITVEAPIQQELVFEQPPVYQQPIVFEQPPVEFEQPGYQQDEITFEQDAVYQPESVVEFDQTAEYQPDAADLEDAPIYQPEPIVYDQETVYEPETIAAEQDVQAESELDIMPSLPYIAGKLETLYEENKIDKPEAEQVPEIPVIPHVEVAPEIPEVKEQDVVIEAMELPAINEIPTIKVGFVEPVQAVEQQPLTAPEIEVEKVVEQPVIAEESIPQQTVVEEKPKSSNPFFDPTMFEQVSEQIEEEQQEEIQVTSPLTDIPFVAYIPEDNEDIEDSPVEVSGPYLSQNEVQMPVQPAFVPAESEVSLPTAQEAATPEISFSDPIIPASDLLVRTVVIGNSIVSDEPQNGIINLVVNQFPQIQKENLVSLMAQDGSGIVFEFTNNNVRNQDTLSNVFSISSDGTVFLPLEDERAAAIDFGKAFITDMPEFGEFLAGR